MLEQLDDEAPDPADLLQAVKADLEGVVQKGVTDEQTERLEENREEARTVSAVQSSPGAAAVGSGGSNNGSPSSGVATNPSARARPSTFPSTVAAARRHGNISRQREAAADSSPEDPAKKRPKPAVITEMVRKPDPQCGPAVDLYWEIQQDKAAMKMMNGQWVQDPKAMVRLWNSTLISRRASDMTAVPGVFFINETYLKRFEDELATQALRSASMAAMRASEPWPHGRKYGIASAAVSAGHLRVQPIQYTGSLAPGPPPSQPIPSTAQLVNRGGKGTIKTCVGCRELGGQSGVRSTKEHKLACDFLRRHKAGERRVMKP